MSVFVRDANDGKFDVSCTRSGSDFFHQLSLPWSLHGGREIIALKIVVTLMSLFFRRGKVWAILLPSSSEMWFRANVCDAVNNLSIIGGDRGLIHLLANSEIWPCFSHFNKGEGGGPAVCFSAPWCFPSQYNVKNSFFMRDSDMCAGAR